MKNRNLIQRLGDFMLGKGFYIVLFLCVATIGISGYYLLNSIAGDMGGTSPVTGNPTVVLPDSEANGPDPAGTITPPVSSKPDDQPTGNPEPVTQPDDPEPVKQPAETTPQEDKPTATVFTWPVKGEILREFSVETLLLDPTLGDWRTHGGLDLSVQAGTQVLAMGDGTVVQVFEDGLMGPSVVIDHGNDLTASYCNLDQVLVAEGDTVETGTAIATVGATAIAESNMGSHLHLETAVDGVVVDPAEYLPQR